MKIRIKGASVRIRLSRTEVATLVHEGSIAERTPFGTAVFKYALQRVEEGDALSASFEGGRITMYVPKSLIQDWNKNSLITTDSHIRVDENTTLYLLLEKDFQCLDAVDEDQSDNYINPNQTC